MSNQELLTFLFNAIALSFLAIAAMDFGTRAGTVYKQVSCSSSSPLTSAQQPPFQLPPVPIPQVRPQLPDPWLLPLPVKESVVLVKEVQREQKHLRLLPSAKVMDISNPELEDLLQGVDLDQLKLRQARKIAKVLGIAQKVNGRDQKLAFLVSQIKSKLQQGTFLQLEAIRLVNEVSLAS